jgi:hypothetical protein
MKDLKMLSAKQTGDVGEDIINPHAPQKKKDNEIN